MKLIHTTTQFPALVGDRVESRGRNATLYGAHAPTEFLDKGLIEVILQKDENGPKRIFALPAAFGLEWVE